MKRASRLALVTASGLAGAYGIYNWSKNHESHIVSALTGLEPPLQRISDKGLPSRDRHLKALQEKEFDVLVIGGGATGAGVALDSITRGLSTALVEADDFASGTSSRSTKLIHGGVRYLQKAILQLDIEQYRMVREALEERANLLEIAPHLSQPLPIMLPVYKWWQLPYYWVGIKAYDLVAGLKNVKSSYVLSRSQALERFPMLKKEKLVGAIVYFDGQQDDARMNLTLVLSAVRYGASAANHTEVIKLLKNNEGKVCGAVCKDRLTGKEFEIRAKTVVNATGPFTDRIRKMDDEKVRPICQPSSGVHIVLPGYYSPENMGLLDPATSDGRVIFFLPWLGSTIAGTTDRPCEVTHEPAPSEQDIQFILAEIRKYLNADVNVRRGDVMSAWSGIRPLVLDPSKPSTESIARNHVIETSGSGLVTIAGGKWTTYRAMAQHTMEALLSQNPQLKPSRECQTKGLLLEGAHGWSPTMFIRLVQDYGLESEVAQHLSQAYGDRAFAVAKLAELTGKRWPVVGKRLHSELPYIEAEVRFAAREYACNAVDVISRRMRIAFLNAEAAMETLPRIVDILAEELNWNDKEKQQQLAKARQYLQKEMAYQANRVEKQSTGISQLSKEEILKYSKQFRSMDRDNKGYIGVNDLRRSFKAAGVKISEQELHAMLSEVDINKNGQVELDEYLELMNGIKSGNISSSRLAIAIQQEHAIGEEREYKKITVERSGGGL